MSGGDTSRGIDFCYFAKNSIACHKKVDTLISFVKIYDMLDISLVTGRF